MMTTFKTRLTASAAKFQTDTSGQFSILAIVSMFAVLASVAVAIDGANGFAAKQRLSATTDAISLIAAKDTTLDAGELQIIAQDYYNLTYPGSAGDRIVVNSINRNGDSVVVDTSNNIDGFFSQVFGMDTLDVRTVSVATLGRRDLDIALVLDNTGSMRERGKLTALKEASNNLVDILYADPTTASGTQLGLVPFASWVNVGTDQIELASLDLRGTSPQNALYFTDNTGRLDRYDALGVDWNGCLENRLPPYDVDDTAPNPARPETLFQPAYNPKSANPADRADTSCDENRKITPLTNNVSRIKRGIRNMTAAGFTNIANGATWGFRLVSPNAPFTQARAYDDPDVLKAMVILTDGDQTMRRERSTISNFAYSPFGYFGETPLRRGKERLEGRSVKEALDRKLTETCEAAKAKGIAVYTITFQLSDGPTQDIMRDCATSPTNYFDVSSANQLTPVFRQIAGSLSNLRLTE